MNSNHPVILSPVEYEKAVAEMLRPSEHGLSGFEVTHREVMQGQDGEYEIDVVARFTALGGDFKVLVECKHHKSPVKRDVVQVLKDRLHSTGSQKGMIFSTSGFQSPSKRRNGRYRTVGLNPPDRGTYTRYKRQI